MFINSSPIESLADIPDRVAPLVMLQPAGVDKRKVFLSADRDVPYRVVVNVMDQLRKTSEKVKIMTMEEGVLMGDGGETKIVVKLKKRPGE
jgi:biopolymer transport protein ExbD